MARSVVTKGQLLKIEGIDEVLAEIARRMALLNGNSVNEVGDALKNLYYETSGILQEQARRNIDGLPIDSSAKTTLKNQVVRGRGPGNKPNAFVAMYQFAIKGIVPNPYWFEYGTKDRVTKKGKRTGRMRPTPFFRPAITQARGAVKQALVDGLKRILIWGKP